MLPIPVEATVWCPVSPFGSQMRCIVLLQCASSVDDFDAEVYQSLVVCHHAFEDGVSSRQPRQRIRGIEATLVLSELQEHFVGATV